MAKSKSCSVNVGSGFGAALAAGLSYITNHSIGYAVLHFFCGWIYVVYNVLTYGLPHLPVR